MSVRGYRHGAIISFFNYRQGDKKKIFGDKKCFLAIKSVGILERSRLPQWR